MSSRSTRRIQEISAQLQFSACKSFLPTAASIHTRAMDTLSIFLSTVDSVSKFLRTSIYVCLVIYNVGTMRCLLLFAVFLVVADESMGRSVPFVFLEKVKDDFKQRYGDGINPHPLADDNDEEDDLFEDRFSIAYNLDREFGYVDILVRFAVESCDMLCLRNSVLCFLNRPRLKEHMQYCMTHPEEINKLSKLKAQITEVKGIMMDNIEKVYFFARSTVLR